VATKGGITEEGIRVLHNGLPRVYDELLDATLAKHALVRDQIALQNRPR
jgi:pyrroline-5-carboxylate reductase